VSFFCKQFVVIFRIFNIDLSSVHEEKYFYVVNRAELLLLPLRCLAFRKCVCCILESAQFQQSGRYYIRNIVGYVYNAEFRNA